MANIGVVAGIVFLAIRYHRIDAKNLQRMIPVFDAFGFVYPTAMAEEVERLRQR